METPRGTYFLREDGVYLEQGEAREMVFSTEYLIKPGNRRQQELETAHFGYRELSFTPRAIVFHPGTSNLVAIVGFQGAVVGDSEGIWSRVPVGPYTPTDFSLSGKLSLIFGGSGLWLASGALSVSFTAMALVFAKARSAWGYAGSLLLALVLFVLPVLSVGLLFPTDIGLGIGETIRVTASLVAIFLGIPVIALALPPRRFLWVVVASLMGLMLLFLVAFLAGTLQGFDPGSR